jgi:hypothetical protein
MLLLSFYYSKQIHATTIRIHLEPNGNSYEAYPVRVTRSFQPKVW